MGRIRARMTAETIEKISVLSEHGIGCTNIGKMLGISETCSKVYVLIIRQIRETGRISTSQGYSKKAIKEWCRMHNIPDPEIKPSETPKTMEQVKMPIAEDKITKSINEIIKSISEDKIMKSINMINAIGVQFHELAEFLYDNYVNRE